jgi:hypothetical protein
MCSSGIQFAKYQIYAMILQIEMEKVINQYGYYENYFRNYYGMSTYQ